MSESTLSFFTVNVRGLGDAAKRSRVFSYLRQHRFDVIALQETHCPTAASASWWTRQWGGTAFWTTFSSRSGGTAILFRRDLLTEIADVDTDPDGRCVRLLVTFPHVDRTYRVSCIYAPNDPTERTTFFERMHDQACGYDDAHDDSDYDNIILGDFNCILDPAIFFAPSRDQRGGGRCSGERKRTAAAVAVVSFTFVLACALAGGLSF